jgi:hypothetical protein
MSSSSSLCGGMCRSHWRYCGIGFEVMGLEAHH